MKRALTIALILSFFFFGSCDDWGSPMSSAQNQTVQGRQQGPILGAKTLDISIDNKWVVKNVTPLDPNAKPDTPNPMCVALVEMEGTNGEVVSLRIKCECYGPSLQGRHLQFLIHDPDNPKRPDGSSNRPNDSVDGSGTGRTNSSAKK
jgi:hypothetical protein